jgi:hypothetical protein
MRDGSIREDIHIVRKGIDRTGLEFTGLLNRLAAKRIILNEYDAKR